jgi:hypothetical protein
MFLSQGSIQLSDQKRVELPRLGLHVAMM